MALNVSEDMLIAANVCSLLQLWDTVTGQMMGVLRPNGESEQEINITSSLAAHPQAPSQFLSGGRDGRIDLWDVRSANKLYWRFWGHEGKISSLEFNESGTNLLSSGREGVIRLWDMRKLPVETAYHQCIQAYTGHVTYGHWVPSHFLSLEKYILSGSETNKAFIYETLTGELVKIVDLGSSKVILTAPVPDSIAFYYINYSTQTVSLCDVEGEDIQPQEQTTLQIKQNFLKEKMQEVMLDCSDQIITQLSRMNALDHTGLHQIVETLSRSADPQAHALLGYLMAQYEERVRGAEGELANRVRSATALQGLTTERDLQGRQQGEEEKSQGKTLPAPSVQVEIAYGKDLPAMIPEECSGEQMDTD
jgi:hypothetical protein